MMAVGFCEHGKQYPCWRCENLDQHPTVLMLGIIETPATKRQNKNWNILPKDYSVKPRSALPKNVYEGMIYKGGSGNVYTVLALSKNWGVVQCEKS